MFLLHVYLIKKKSNPIVHWGGGHMPGNGDKSMHHTMPGNGHKEMKELQALLLELSSPISSNKLNSQAVKPRPPVRPALARYSSEEALFLCVFRLDPLPFPTAL